MVELTIDRLCSPQLNTAWKPFVCPLKALVFVKGVCISIGFPRRALVFIPLPRRGLGLEESVARLIDSTRGRGLVASLS